MRKRKVILRRCDEYNPKVIQGIIREAMEELGEKPKGKILIKPNVVTANKQYIFDSYTNRNVTEAMVNVLRESYGADGNITIGESGGIGLPTRLFFAESDYDKLSKRLNVPLVDLNEEELRTVTLKKAKWHKTMLMAKSLYEAEYKIWMPKLKFHIVVDITNALKLNIGILSHKERFLYHDDRLHEKIVDLLEPGYPDLVVTDAITVGRGFESSPFPHHLGAIMISNDPLAADVVAAKIMNYEPESVIYLREARDRGYGSLDINDVVITGDVGWEELAARMKGVDSPFQDLQKLDTPIRFYEGANKSTGNICYGGCICSIKGVMGTADRRYEGNLKNAKKGAIVMGYYRGDVVHPGEPVVLVGTCAGVEGRLEAGKVVHIKGCPVKVADLMIFGLRHFKMKSPAWDMRNLMLLIYYSVIKAFMQLTVPLRGRAKIHRHA
ncbi:MAG: DUF362 domain-containing protein [Spirochaetes bacterium]|jgi:uncharacterized protein (DUF362 family)|nr:DUF362 domain-containing protein [Spirochaetota bacterium]